MTETQEPRYDGWRIVAPVLAGNLWSEPEPAFPNIDRRASEDRYIELFERALATEFPGAEISTEFNDNTEGSPPRPRVTIVETGDVDADSQALEDAIDTIDRLGQDLWDGHDWYVEKHYGLTEFARYLGWGKTRLGNMRDRGQVPAPALRIGTRPAWTHEQVVAFAATQREEDVLAAVLARATDGQARAEGKDPEAFLLAGGHFGADATPEEIAKSLERYRRGRELLATHALRTTCACTTTGGLPRIEGAVAEAVVDAGHIATAKVWVRVALVPRRRLDQTGLRPVGSAYDTAEGVATDRLLDALLAAGHVVELPVTGAVIVGGIEIPYKEWMSVATAYDGDLDATLAAIEERFGAKE